VNRLPQPADDGGSPEPIDYEEALRDLLSKRRRRRFTLTLRRFADPRPSSPAQVMLLGLALALAGALVPAVHVALLVGLGLLAFGFITSLIQPRGRTVSWRNRQIYLPPEKSWTHSLYYVFYRRNKPE
jgi:hypothetical protein